MKYEKPEISFQKFHIDSFLNNESGLSGDGNDPDIGWDPDDGFSADSAGFNGTITLNSNGVGGWFNG